VVFAESTTFDVDVDFALLAAKRTAPPPTTRAATETAAPTVREVT
jgi:hypothetical protein